MKKFFKRGLTILSFCMMSVLLPIFASGCSAQEEISVRVEDEYIQWQVDGSDSWNNLLTIDELKGLLGEAYIGNPGINGREVEFRATETHIQWRYVDNTQEENENWKNLIVLTELRGTTGQDGTAGDDGLTPFVGSNGNWWIGEEDTGVKAKGVDGREVEFQKTETHIQWRYITSDDSDEWKDVIAFDDLIPTEMYTISYDYNMGFDVSGYFDNYKTSQTIESGKWITDMPLPKSEFDVFDGWYVKNEDRKISSIDCIQGDVDLVAKYKTSGYTFSLGCNSDKFEYNDELGGYECSLLNQENIIVPSDYDGIYGRRNIVRVNGVDSVYFDQKIKSVKLPDTIIEIAEKTFYRLDKLTELYIPKNVNKIEVGAISYCPNITSLVVDKDNKKYDSRNECNAIVETKTGTLISGCSTTSLYSVDKINKIGEYAFEGQNVKTIIIPNSVTTIGVSAFAYNSNLESVSVINVTTIEEKAFYYCESLLGLNGNRCVTTIGDDAFMGCKKLKSVSFIDNIADIVTIGNSAFGYCESLKEVNFADNIQSIGTGVFANCTGIEFISVSVNEINSNTFLNCISLKSVNLGDVEYIYSGAFSGCTSLESIRIPSTVKSVNSAFGHCDNLNTIIILSEDVANDIISENSVITASVETVYILSELSVSDSIYLLDNFTKQSTSDMDGFDMYTRNF